jgi:hypothetical protein
MISLFAFNEFPSEVLIFRKSKKRYRLVAKWYRQTLQAVEHQMVRVW